MVHRRDNREEYSLGATVVGEDGPVCILPSHRSASRLLRSWWQRWLWRHPILHGSVSEIRSCYRRIDLPRKRGRALLVSTGLALLAHVAQGLCPNTTSQGRTQGIKRLPSVRP